MSSPSEHDLANHWTGSIYAVPDKLWGFELVVPGSHPGACLGGDERTAIFLQGTDVENDWGRRGRTRVLPSASNGLRKETSFRLAPRRLRWRRACLLHPERHLGKLDADDLLRLRTELDEALDPEAGH